MKKHKILIVALAMAVMCTGAGYAYWTQTLNINNTVNTGNMDVGFISATDAAWDNGYISRNCSALVTLSAIVADNKQSLDFTVNNFYPGAGASLDFVVQNTGTVAAKITDVTGNETYNKAFCDALNYKYTSIEVCDVLGVPLYKKVVDLQANNVPDLAAGLTTALKDIVIQPGQYIVLRANGILGSGETASPGYEILMPSTISGSDFEKSKGSFSLGLAFTQVN